MKKLRLRALSLGAREILSREQLKHITGGSGAAGQPCSTLIDCPVDYWCGQSNTCVYAGIPGSGSGNENGSGPPGGSIGDTCDGVYDEHGVFIKTCPQYSQPNHVFVGCIPCDNVIN